ncbi:MAG: hypothetical protein COV37_10255 [Bdellovibrio sp. CG11_big_fil_rev_8_21_14_0_20_39_38]|nr:MAG: hypothetical protein COW78_04345 [Bdellovibrio sp. CG22_combo_CG10-13_8_21_14_all_39_27]PIR35121.1 MAG: hypothetical protein COV37_10255 [Bdellovibrio sp. CG11_big_fil_rev_8_21_14_0_20_39_38]
MTNNNDDDDNDFADKSDMTRIENLAEFLHQEDPEVDAQLESAADKKTEEEEQELPPSLDLNELEDTEQVQTEEAPPEFIQEEIAEEESVVEVLESEPAAEEEEVSFDSNSEWEGESASEFESSSIEDFTSSDEQEWESTDEQEWDPPEETTEGPDEAALLEEETEVFESPVVEEEAFSVEEEEDVLPPMEEPVSPPSPAPIAPVPHSQRPPLNLKKREDFQDLRLFGEALSYGTVTYGGQPPFTLKATGIHFQEDAEDIMSILEEHGLITEENRATYLQMLEHNSLLISQISEFSAIYLSHRLRRFKLQLSLGLSDEMNPSKSYEKEGRGLVTKYNLRQNVREEMAIKKTSFEARDVLLSTSNTFEGLQIKRYYDIISTHSIISEEEMKSRPFGHRDEETVGTSEELSDFEIGLNAVYKELASDMKNEAFKREANAVVGVSYQITPLPSQSENGPKLEYKITCTGSAVWVEHN